MDGSKLLERLAKTELGQQLLREEGEEILSRRKELAGEINELAVAFEAKLPGLQEAEQKALAVVERAREKLKAAEEAHRQAVMARTHASNSYGGRRGRLEGELVTTASPVIRALRGELQTLFDNLRRNQFGGRESRRDALGRTIASEGPDPYKALADRLRRVQEAMRGCESLMVLALDEEELSQRLEALRASTDGK